MKWKQNDTSPPLGTIAKQISTTLRVSFGDEPNYFNHANKQMAGDGLRKFHPLVGGKMKQDWPKDAQETVENLHKALRSEKALCSGMIELVDLLQKGIEKAV